MSSPNGNGNGHTNGNADAQLAREPARVRPQQRPQPASAGEGQDRPHHGRRRLHRLRPDRAPARPRLPRPHPRPPLLGRRAARAVRRPRRGHRAPTCATCPATALDGVDGVIHLAGLSNDPTAEYDPEANWQMNADRDRGARPQACVDRGVERFVFASSCSLYDGLPPGMHDETADDRAARRVRDLQALRRGGAARARRRGPVPGHPAQRHGLRLQPAHALRPRRQHVRQGRAAAGASSRCTAAAGCGGRWSTSATSPTR